MSLWSWGANSHGQLSIGETNEQVKTPTKVVYECCNSHGVQQVACGGGHSLLLDKDGKLFSCGWNIKLQLGKENETEMFERVWKLSGIKFTNIVCGWDFSCAVTDDNFLFVWGSNSNGQLGLPKEHFTDIVKPIRLQVNACSVSMGLRHTAIVNSKGEVWITGCGKHGQLGLGEETLQSDRFQNVQKVGKITHIACGQNHTAAWCTEEKALYVWGDNKHGQLLLSPEKYKKIYTPQKIDIDVKQGIRKLLSGWTNMLLWLENGTLLCWGRNSYGQLGTEQPFVGKIVKVNLPDNRMVQDIALGSEHTICLATDNTLWAWGWNEHANTGTDSGEHVFQPTQVLLNMKPNEKITQIYAGGAHNFIYIEDTKQEVDLVTEKSVDCD
ncbi:secretion-regulating guanine nucleotide exchange factor-like [Cydia fagiglandana]|uniref:secretion-regulating guanine nucleotide exchange factor-like n=1 Tax=Cydia fagiglandana TaxID=1458189 RepID=UPI002FEE00C7